MKKGITYKTELEQWDMVIEPHRHLLDLKLGDLWRYKDLVLLFVRRTWSSP
jgi:lipopolysaccharide transport system permease protein